MVKIIIFENPKESEGGRLPYMNAMVHKPSKEVEVDNICGGIDYIQRPRIHYEHLARVMEAKAKKINESL
jgi:hypothetical protein